MLIWLRMYIAVHSHSYLDFLHIYDVLVIGREITLPVWLSRCADKSRRNLSRNLRRTAGQIQLAPVLL